jgi:hypothetical protein
MTRSIYGFGRSNGWVFPQRGMSAFGTKRTW